MIDDPQKAFRLVHALEATLPIETTLSPSLVRTLSDGSPGLAIPARCNVTGVYYAGDDGGIVCALDLGAPGARAAHFVSITHLRFERKLPVFGQIDAYQRHRIKKLKQQARHGD